jgi:hypothetical protein
MCLPNKEKKTKSYNDKKKRARKERKEIDDSYN